MIDVSALREVQVQPSIWLVDALISPLHHAATLPNAAAELVMDGEGEYQHATRATCAGSARCNVWYGRCCSSKPGLRAPEMCIPAGLRASLGKPVFGEGFWQWPRALG